MTTPVVPAHVMVVDDDPHTRNLLKDLCETCGFVVSQAEDGVQTLERLAQEKPDLLLLDLMMPRMDGFQVLKGIRESPSLRDLPVIVLTAIGDMDGKIRGMELGADDYVTKPFKLIELQTRISSTLSVKQMRQKLAAAEDELGKLRAVDPVTGAGTYSQLKASLDAELSRAKRYSRPASALLFGFEDYQGLRYQLGRDGCDLFLTRMTQAVKDALRGADALFRLDVDEFVALLPETDLKGARITAERLQRVVGGLPVSGRAGPVEVKLRFSGATFPHPRVQSSEELLRECNRVYRALRDAGPEHLIFEA